MIPVIKPELSLKELLFAKKATPEKFEKEFAKVVGTKHAISFPYGRTSLYAILSALDVKKSEVVLPAYTCIVVADAIVESGNIPKFVDIDNTFNTPIENIKKSINNKTKAIVPTHMYGYPIDVKQIKDSIREDILIIEDACLALQSSINGKKTGCMADVGIFAFGVAKQITTLNGGMVVTNNKEIYEKILNFKEQTIKQNTLQNTKKKLNYIFNLMLYKSLIYKTLNKLYSSSEFLRKKATWENWSMEKIELPEDFLNNFTNFQASIGISQLRRLKEFTKKRTDLVNTYNEFIRNKHIEKPPIIKGTAYSHYTIRCSKRDYLREVLRKSRINTGLAFNYSIPETKAYRKFAKEKFKMSSDIAKTIINLPLYPSLTEEQVKFICDAINKTVI